MIFNATIGGDQEGRVVGTIAPVSGIYSMRVQRKLDDEAGFSLAASMIAIAARMWANHLEMHICGVTGSQEEIARKRQACVHGYYIGDSPIDGSLVALPCEFPQCKQWRAKINSLIPDVRFRLEDPAGFWPEKLSHYIVP